MEKQLNKKEIEQILCFLKSHKVRHYDVQLELLDHFASAIEVKWDNYPENWSFEDKILDVYNEIEPRGFSKIIGEKSMIVILEANKFAFDVLKDSFKIPQIILTLVCLYFLHQEFLTMADPIQLFKLGLVIPYGLLLFGTIMIYGFYYWQYRQRILTLESSINLHLIVPHILMISTTWINKTDFPFPSEIYLLFSIMIFIQIIYCMGFLIVVKNIFRESKSRYAHFSRT